MQVPQHSLLKSFFLLILQPSVPSTLLLLLTGFKLTTVPPTCSCIFLFSLAVMFIPRMTYEIEKQLNTYIIKHYYTFSQTHTHTAVI